MSAKVERLRFRGQLLRLIREFFHARAFVEVDTPVRVKTPALEDHIDAEPAGHWYLRTSPELHMKRLLGRGVNAIFQIGPCFRRGEMGTKHRPEFTMLEWYEVGKDYNDILNTVQELLSYTFRGLLGSQECSYRGDRISVGLPWIDVSVGELLERYAHVDAATAIGSDRFESIWIEIIEPRLDRGKPTVARDYPIELGAFARTKTSDPRVVERWELFMGGLEIANAYSELTDVAEQQRRFVATAEKRRQAGRETYPLDQEFLEALERGMPASAGCALGVDRLLMIMTDAQDINQVVAF